MNTLELLPARQSLKATQPKIKQTGHFVSETTDYGMFKMVNGNRQLNPHALKRIAESMKKTPLFSPIMVNEKYEIIDGQHRFTARKNLRMPIQFIVVPGYGVNEVHTLNTNNSNWKKADYLEGYADMGIRSYVMLKQFQERFPDFNISSSIKLSGDSSKSAGRKIFENGEFIFKDLANANKIATMLMDFKPHYDGFNRLVFVVAFMSIVKNRNYNHQEMITRLNRAPHQITDQTNSENVKLQLEDIYNAYRRKKVSLRY